MKITSILLAESIDINFNAKTKDEAIEKLVKIASSKYKLAFPSERILEEVFEREKQMSTGVGDGVAFPHARIKDFNDSIVVMGICKEGLDYGSVDNKPVQIIVLILSNNLKNTLMLQILGAFSKLFKNKDTRENIINAKSAQDIIKIIDKSEVQIKKSTIAKDIMTTDFITVNLDMTIKEVVRTFFKGNIPGAPVVNEQNEILGEITEKQLIKIGLPEYMHMLNDISFLKNFEPFEEFFKQEEVLKVKDIYSKDIHCVHEETSIIEVAFLMVDKGCRRVYVVRGKELIGMVTRHKLLTKVLYI